MKIEAQPRIPFAPTVYIRSAMDSLNSLGISGFPAIGNQIKMSGATVYCFDAGCLTGRWQITDRLRVYVQLRQALASAWAMTNRVSAAQRFKLQTSAFDAAAPSESCLRCSSNCLRNSAIVLSSRTAARATRASNASGWVRLVRHTDF